MKNKKLIVITILIIILIVSILYINPSKKSNLSKWDGKSPLGNPDLIKIVDNFISTSKLKDVPEDFYSEFEYNEIKRFCDPIQIDKFCVELYNGNLNKVPQTKKRALLYYSTGAINIVPIEIDIEEKVVRSQRAESKKAWEILDEIPRTDFNIFKGMPGKMLNNEE